MRVAAVQMNATADKGGNLSRAERLVEQAARAGAVFVSLPEIFNLRGGPDVLRAGAEPLEGETMTWASRLAARLQIHFLAGSFTEKVEGEERYHNTSCLFDPNGQRQAVYRKIHLFDVDVPGARTRESEAVLPGREVVLSRVESLGLGFTVCYDLRFPELYRALTVRGARLIVVPAAFTERTGRDHWEVLLRARAIENQVFIVAANQWGSAPGTPVCYGRSLIIDAWGTVLAQAPDADTAIVADLDLDAQQSVREKLPCLSHRRPEIYGSALGALLA